MRACSFLPAATQMIYDLELEDLLYGVTFECPEKARKEKEVLVRSTMEGKNYSSEEIDQIFSAAKKQGQSLYYIEEDKLRDLQPDLIFTQDTCEVCQIDTACTKEVIDKFSKKPQLIPLSPKNFKEICNSLKIIAQSLGFEEKADTYLLKIEEKLERIKLQLKNNNTRHKDVLFIEWIDPLYNSGHWITEQINLAGGQDRLCNPGGYSSRLSFAEVLNYNPEIIIIAPCGFSVERSLEEINLLKDKNSWQELTAVKNNMVFIADANLFTQPSLSTLVQGIELLAHIFNPELFSLDGSWERMFCRGRF